MLQFPGVSRGNTGNLGREAEDCSEMRIRGDMPVGHTEGRSMKTAVIIPNFNGLHFLGSCMSALAAQTEKGFLTLVIDNGSGDGSVSWLTAWEQEDAAHRKLILNTENLGFSGAVNQGIEYAAEEGFLYALLLNNDTEADPHFVKALEQAMEGDRRKRVFAFSSRMVKMHDPSLIDDAGDEMTIMNWQFQRGVEKRCEDYLKPCRVFSACAGAAIYRIEALKVTGLFDLHHFAYLEDVDISYRANLYGYQLRYLPTAVCRHVGSGTSGGKYSDFKVRLSARNSIYLLYKNMPGWQKLLNLLPLCLGYLAKYLFFVRRGFGKAYRSGVLEGIRTRRQLTRARLREVPLRRILSIELRFIVQTFVYLKQRRKR